MTEVRMLAAMVRSMSGIDPGDDMTTEYVFTRSNWIDLTGISPDGLSEENIAAATAKALAARREEN